MRSTSRPLIENQTYMTDIESDAHRKTRRIALMLGVLPRMVDPDLPELNMMMVCIARWFDNRLYTLILVLLAFLLRDETMSACIHVFYLSQV